LCGGVALNGWYLKTMRDGNAPIRTDKPVPNLTTTGPFRYIRNPGYLALTPILGDNRGVATESRREAARRG
jgi:protein-S-isoprenylcysteine O-methyltransferase Ste14